jgi:hypothetical protein
MVGRPEGPPPEGGLPAAAKGDLTQWAGGDIVGRDKIAGDWVYGDKYEIHNYGSAPTQLRAHRGVPPPTVPGLPSPYLARPELLAQGRAALLTPVKTRRARTVGLVGMGGAGKSVVARALAHDGNVQAAFPDGIVWLELGPRPDLPARQAQLAEILGDPRPPVVDLQQGLARLNGLLTGAACLIVLDNVWEYEHLRAFDLLEPRCALLLTSRHHDVLDRSALCCRVGLLDRQQAQELLAAWAGQDPAHLPAEAAEVALECGGLALALAIAGGLVADGRTWRSVRERLRRAHLNKLASRFRDYPYPTLLRALEASIAALTAEERARYLELAVLEGHGEVPVGVVQRLWQQGGLEELDGEDLIALLARRSLLQLDEASGTLTLHDLQFDYIRQELDPDAVRVLHARMATGYLAGWGGLDQRLPDLRAMHLFEPAERHGLLHLATHLISAGQDEAVHQLLAADWPTDPAFAGRGRAENAWYLAHERAGETAAYLRDVSLALRLAEAVTDQALASGEPAPSIGLEVRYALVTASIVSIAGNIPPALLVAVELPRSGGHMNA